MAANTAKKKTTSSKGSAASGKSTASGGRAAKTSQPENRRAVHTPAQEPERESANPMIMREAALWLVLAVCILIFISYLGIGGYVGEVISDVSFGIFGITAYLFPFLLFVAAAFLISNRGSRVAGVKFLSSLGLYLCICSFATLFTKEYQEISDIIELYENSAAHKNGGGVIGGLVCALLRPALGAIGTGIVLLILTIVFLVLITQKSLMRSVKHQGSRVYQSAKESGARRREAFQRERESRRNTWDLPEEFLDLPENADGQSGSPQGKTLPEPQPVQRQEMLPGRGKKRGMRKELQEGRSSQQATQQYPQGNNPAGYGAAGQDMTSHTQRTQIEVPILFPVNGREHRKVSGVTTDTRIQGDPTKVGTEIHEIVPKNASQKSRTARSAATPGTDRKNSYIELTESVPEKKRAQGTSGLEFYHDTPDVSQIHIEGIRTEDEETQKTAVTSGTEKLADAPARTERTLAHETSRPKSGDELTGQNEDAGEDVQQAAQGDTNGHEPSAKRNPRSSQKEIEEGIASVEAEMAKTAETVRPEYIYPPIDLLKKGKGGKGGNQEQEIRSTAAKLQQTLDSFGVHATVTNVSCGPSVTRYELLPEQGVKVSRIVGLSDDIKLNLAAADIRTSSQSKPGRC